MMIINYINKEIKTNEIKQKKKGKKNGITDDIYKQNLSEDKFYYDCTTKKGTMDIKYINI